MGTPFASGKNSIAMCDVCGQQFKLKKLKELVVKTKKTNIMACPECWDPDHPQLKLGMYPVNDPQAIRNPRPDTTYAQSRQIQWGWAPVGGGNALSGTPNALVATGYVGTVTVVMS
jgi:hypothetical protein